MDQDKVDKAINVLVKADLPDGYESLVKTGEVPYQANLAAMKAFDIKEDAKTGRKEAKKVLAGIDKWIKELEAFENAANDVATASAAALRSHANFPSDEEDSEEDGSDKEVVEGN